MLIIACIILVILIGIITFFIIYKNYKQLLELRRSWDNRIYPMPTVEANYVANIPPNTIIIDVIQEV